MALKFKNFWVSALAVAATSTDTTLTIPTGDAANLPSLTGGDTLRLVLPVVDASGAETDWEIVEVSAINTTTGALTVTRGVEGTTAKSWAINTIIDMRLTAGALAGIGAPQPNLGGAALENYTDKTIDINVTTANTTIDFAVITGRAVRLMMGASTTLAFANVPTSGVTALTLICIQDTTGGRTLTFPAGTKYAGGTAPVLSTAAGAEDWLEVVFHPAMAGARVFTAGKGMA